MMQPRVERLIIILGAGVIAAATPAERPLTRAASIAPEILLVQVIEETSGRALPNAEVLDLESGVRRLTNVDGEARLPWPDAGTMRMRVRQLGFQYVDRLLTRVMNDGAVRDTVTIALARVAYVLPDVSTRATSECDGTVDPAAAALSVVALSQLKMSAERYDAFRKAYPFTIRQQRRTIRFAPTGVARNVREEEEQETSNGWGEPYRLGKVIDRRASGFSVPLLFLSALADPVFWQHHCFAVRGIESLADARVLRLEFAPTPSVAQVDWMGTAFIDSATSVLRRVEFQLAGLQDGDVVRRLEGYTTFRSPSPFIVIPDSTLAMWWRRDASSAPGGWAGPDVVQLLRLLEVKYKKAKPPEGR
jgi:hypothetical protein